MLATHRLLTPLLLGILSTAGCRPAPVGAFGALVRNKTEAEAGREACAGGLRAKFTLSGVVIYDKVVAAEEEDSRRSGTADNDLGELVKQGAPVTVEAWCLTTEGGERGYAEARGLLNLYRSADSVLVSPEPSDSTVCEGEVRRGKFPCIQHALD